MSVLGYIMVRKIKMQRAYQAFLAAFRNATPGDKIVRHIIPKGLRKQYEAEEVLGRGAFGCVVRARAVRGEYLVAIKLIVPQKGAFDAREMRQLARESAVLQLFTSSKCEHAVKLAGVEAVCITPDLCWFIMENLHGDNMEVVVHDADRGPISDLECIKAARNVLAALKAGTTIAMLHEYANLILFCLGPYSVVKKFKCAYYFRISS